MDANQWLPVITAVMTAIPTTIGAILVTRSRHRDEVEASRKLLLRDTRAEMEKLSIRVDSLDEERDTCEKKLAYLTNELAKRGLLGEITDGLERIETANRSGGKDRGLRGHGRKGKGGFEEGRGFGPGRGREDYD